MLTTNSSKDHIRTGTEKLILVVSSTCQPEANERCQEGRDTLGPRRATVKTVAMHKAGYRTLHSMLVCSVRFRTIGCHKPQVPERLKGM